MISFIIPVFNCETNILECVNSILTIDLDKEIILVDDGSTDSSSSLCLGLAQNYSYIKYVLKDNGGAASARNVGIDNCNGEYIVFVDGDDTLDSTWEKSVKFALKHVVDLYVYGMAFDYYTNGSLERTGHLSNKYSGIENKNNIEAFFKEFFVNNTVSSACNKVFKTDIIKKNNIRFNEFMTLYEDMDFVMQYLRYVENVYFIPDALYHYRLNDDDSHYRRRIADLCKVRCNLDCLYETTKKFSDKVNVLSVISNLYVDILWSSLMLNDFSEDNKALLSSYADNQNILNGTLNDNNKKLINMIQNKQFNELFMMIKYRKLKSNLKRTVKKIIGRK